jgi:cytochrome c5
MVFNLLTFFAVGPLLGQTKQSVQAEIPYPFTVASNALPAGTYTFTVTEVGLEVRPAAGGMFRALIVTRLGGPTELFRDGTLVFDKMGDRRILSEVWIPGTDGVLVHSTPKGHAHDILLLSGANPGPGLSGSATYDRTCRRCHGPHGNGDESADKFFKIAIPRLDSAAVQSKSDAELKEIIAKGTSAMPPVEVEESGFRHRLPPQSVDAVIAYVRTFKQ